jgi:hypothetical protein
MLLNELTDREYRPLGKGTIYPRSIITNRCWHQCYGFALAPLDVYTQDIKLMLK